LGAVSLRTGLLRSIIGFCWVQEKAHNNKTINRTHCIIFSLFLIIDSYIGVVSHMPGAGLHTEIRVGHNHRVAVQQVGS
jgi:hypothetical protein